MDAMRKQLDVLMGANRNGDVREVNRKYYDRDVCRLYLVGLCPHELFQLTKMDMGPCPKVHSLQLRKDYEEARAKGVDNYDVELENVIDKLIVECDKKIGRALKRLEDDDAKAAIAISVTEVTQTPEVIELSKQIKEKLKEADQHDLEGKTDFKIQALEEVEKLRSERAEKQSALLLEAFNKDRASLPQPMPNPPSAPPMLLPTPDPRTQEMINEKLKKAEDLGEQGMVDEAQKALEEAEALKKLPGRQEPTVDSSKYSAADVRITDQKLRVCDICGAFLSVYDSDRRLADHFGGKLHLGYMQIREKLTELQIHFSFADCFFRLIVQKLETCVLNMPKSSQLLMVPKSPSMKTSTARVTVTRIGDRKNGAETVAENQAGIKIGEIAVTGGGIMIEGAEIMTGMMTGIVDMIVNMSAAVMIQEVFADHVLDLENILGIMIAIGAMIDIKILLSSWVWEFVLLPRSVNLWF